MNFIYELIRSDRKSFSIQIKRDGGILVRAPRQASMRMIEQVLQEKEAWIRKNREQVLQQLEQQSGRPEAQRLSEAELNELADRAMKYIPERVRHYAPLVGVTYGRITIRNQRTRWGSCSSAGNLNFNCLLMLAPPQVLDSVVVHELCHRKEMNHSGRFYEEVYRVFPEYDKWHGWLKEHGEELLSRNV